MGELIDNAAHKLDEKTGGRYSDKIDHVVDAVRDLPMRPRGRKNLVTALLPPE